MKQLSDKITFKESIQINKRAFVLINRHCPGMFLSKLLFSVFSAFLPYVPIYFSARIINELAGARNVDSLITWILAELLTVVALKLVVAVLQRWKNAKEYSWWFKRQGVLMGKQFSMDYADMDNQANRDLYTQIQQSENWNGHGLSKILWSVEPCLQSVCGIISAALLTFSLFALPVPETAGLLTVLNHPLSAVLVLALLLAAVIVSPALISKADAYWSSLAEHARGGNRVFSYFTGYAIRKEIGPDIRMYSQQMFCRHYLNQEKTFSAGGMAGKLAKGPMGLLRAASSCISGIMVGIIYVFVCLKAWAGAFGIGAVTQYIGSLTAMTGNIALLLQTVGELKNNTPFVKTLFEYMDIPNAMYQGSLTTEKRSDRQYEVEFRNVSFKYPGSEIWALKNVSMKFKVGKRLAIVGENGSGKTTFIKLLCRLYDPQEGQILLNGIDIRKYRYDDYMNIFAVVFQDFQLISQPLGNNVAGSADYDRDRVKKALTDAGFANRLAEMPDGLDTMLYKDFGENGVEVSGGEAQKIAIARALYKDAPFIILDEPTAALDPIAEAEIYSKFNDISGDKTAIYISHRLSSCKFCDEIAVFHEGGVIQQGSHDALLADTGGKYHELWHAQAQYYTAET